MEMLKAEVDQVEVASNAAHTESIQELNDIQLVLVGGGSGIVVVQ